MRLGTHSGASPWGGKPAPPRALRCLERRPGDPADPNGATRPDLDERWVDEPREPIVCGRCHERISDRSALFLIDSDRLQRVFANPGGYLHEIVTVRWTVGLVHTGPPTEDFSWYAGYAWEIATCGRCGGHVGWRFGAVDAHEPGTFWGLRRAAIEGA